MNLQDLINYFKILDVNSQQNNDAARAIQRYSNWEIDKPFMKRIKWQAEKSLQGQFPGYNPDEPIGPQMLPSMQIQPNFFDEFLRKFISQDPNYDPKNIVMPEPTPPGISPLQLEILRRTKPTAR